jgi:uncharacterized protein HemX
MKTVKILLGVVVVLLVLGIGFGVYVWYTLQQINKTVGGIDMSQPAQSESASSSPEHNASVSGEDTIVIEATDLTPVQQNALKSFGFQGEQIVITQDMIVCAEDAVTKVRLDEILGGAAPTPLEAMKLLPCLK